MSAPRRRNAGAHCSTVVQLAHLPASCRPTRSIRRRHTTATLLDSSQRQRRRHSRCVARRECIAAQRRLHASRRATPQNTAGPALRRLKTRTCHNPRQHTPQRGAQEQPHSEHWASCACGQRRRGRRCHPQLAQRCRCIAAQLTSYAARYEALRCVSSARGQQPAVACAHSRRRRRWPPRQACHSGASAGRARHARAWTPFSAPRQRWCSTQAARARCAAALPARVTVNMCAKTSAHA
jgi:hypothetical protein